MLFTFLLLVRSVFTLAGLIAYVCCSLLKSGKMRKTLNTSGEASAAQLFFVSEIDLPFGHGCGLSSI